jgi:hypothetical protein
MIVYRRKAKQIEEEELLSSAKDFGVELYPVERAQLEERAAELGAQKAKLAREGRQVLRLFKKTGAEKFYHVARSRLEKDHPMFVMSDNWSEETVNVDAVRLRVLFLPDGEMEGRLRWEGFLIYAVIFLFCFVPSFAVLAESFIRPGHYSPGHLLFGAGILYVMQIALALLALFWVIPWFRRSWKELKLLKRFWDSVCETGAG